VLHFHDETAKVFVLVIWSRRDRWRMGPHLGAGRVIGCAAAELAVIPPAS
jgi:hypothetical protein